MTRSYPITIAGRFIAVALADEGVWKLRATDPALPNLGDTRYPNLDSAMAAARRALYASPEGRPAAAA